MVKSELIEFVTYHFIIFIFYFNQNYRKSNKDETITYQALTLLYIWCGHKKVFRMLEVEVFALFLDGNTLGFDYRKKSS